MERRLHVVPPEAGRAADDLHGARAPLRLHGELVVVVVQRPAGLGPVLDEGRLQPVDRRPLDPQVGVAPLVLVARVAAPLLRDADAAGEADPAVHHADLAVQPVVGLERRLEQRLAEPLDLDAGPVHLLDQRLLDQPAAEGVDEQPHPDPGPGPLGHRLGELHRDVALPVDERHQVDGRLGAADRVEHRREDLVAVAQHLDGVALGERRADHHLEAAAEHVDLVAHSGVLPVGARSRRRAQAGRVVQPPYPPGNVSTHRGRPSAPRSAAGRCAARCRGAGRCSRP